MALDHEQLRRRRQQRQAQRKAKQRKIMIALILVGVILVSCGVVIAITALRNRPQKAEQPEQETTAYVPDLTTLRLAAVGDVNITDQVVAAGGSGYDYSALFMDVAHLLADADVTLANFEGTMCATPYGGKNQSAPPQFAQSLSRAGIDCVQVANSYSMNGGLSGLRQTLSGLRGAGLIPLGAFESNEAFQKSGGYTILEVQGVRIALVAFTKGMGGTALLEDSKDCVNLLYTDYTSTYQQVDTEGIRAVLTAVAEEKPDVTVAMLHWGSEYNDTISKSQDTICQLMHDGGVDVILGSHSHYVQKMVLDPETGKFVAYSLGDFLGDGAKAGSNYSVILELELTRNNDTGVTEITGFNYTPVFIVKEEGQPMRLLRIREAVAAYEAGQLDRVSKETYQEMQYALERIDKRIAGE